LLSRLDRYLLREVAVTFLAVTGVLLVVLLSNQFARVLAQAAQNEFAARVVLELIGLTTLQQLTVLVPIGLFLGIVLALGRLYNESEMTAMAACGVGSMSIFRPILLLTLLVVALLAVLSYRVVPAAWMRAREIRVEALRAAQFGALEPGRFRNFAGGDAVFYAEKVDKSGELFGVFVQRHVKDRVEIAVAERAVQRGAGQPDQMFVLFNGRRYEGVPGTRNWRIVEFKEHGIPFRLPEFKGRQGGEEVKATADLLRSDAPRDKAELGWRTAVPLMALVLMALAVPLAKLRPRQGRFARIGLAVLAYFLYSNLIAAVRVWVEKDAPGGQFGFAWVHLLPLLLAGWLLWRDEHPGRLWPLRRAKVRQA
jgi:lipopolysaccharide export system permease protein